jgi:hypothetical protein
MTRPDYFIDNLVPEATYRLSVLDVPILLNAGSSPLSLNATLLGKELSGSAIELLAHRLMDGARACAAEILATR